jgi:hypothetical protein
MHDVRRTLLQPRKEGS